MSIYAIGDVQGCYTALQQLLVKLQFNPQRDRLWFAGDIVNRGPQSLEVLRFVKNLGEQHKVVLGNHDLTLLAVAYGTRALRSTDTFTDILAAPDKDELLVWLRQQPLLHYDANLRCVMTHAGLAPMWDLAKAQALAKEVEAMLQGEDIVSFLQQMYGNEPDSWRDDLQGMARLRCITNYFTRMRVCDAEGRLELSYAGSIADMPSSLYPWFAVPKRLNKEITIIFGHWAALNGVTQVANIYALDTGCVWGNCLTAMNVETGVRVSVECGSVL